MREIIAAPFPGLDLRQHNGHHQSPAIRAGGLIVWARPASRPAAAVHRTARDAGLRR